MPKPAKIHILVEEIAVGRVMNLLNSTPGVMRIDLDMGIGAARPTKKPNGRSGERHLGKPPKTSPGRGGHNKQIGGMSGVDFMAQLFLKAKSPLNNGDLEQLFERAGRSVNSTSSNIHSLKTDGLIEHLGHGQGYRATKKLRERFRKR